MNAILVLFFVAAAHAAGSDGTKELKVVFSSNHCKAKTGEITLPATVDAAEALKKGTEELHKVNDKDEQRKKAVFTKMYIVKDNAEVTEQQIKDLKAGAATVAVGIRLCTGEDPVPAPAKRGEPVVPVPGVGLPAGAGNTKVKITFTSTECKTPTAEIEFEPTAAGAAVLAKGSEELKKLDKDAACQSKVFAKLLLVKDNADVTAKTIKDIETAAKEICVKVKLE